MEQKTEASQAVDKLLPCAFCGSFAVLKEIGNDHTKTRSVQVKCANFECRVERTDKAMARGMEWLRAVAIENWNRRPALKAQPAPTEAPKIICIYPSSRHLPPCDECVAAGGCIQSGHKGMLKASTEAQGEDSARLDFIAAHGCDGGDYGNTDWYVAGETYLNMPLREAIDRARASAETGGVEP